MRMDPDRARTPSLDASRAGGYVRVDGVTLHVRHTTSGPLVSRVALGADGRVLLEPFSVDAALHAVALDAPPEHRTPHEHEYGRGCGLGAPRPTPTRLA